ncbi:MAG: tRNA-specific 2-thiouridylase MnmA [Chlamydiae bacterium]|nr:tRNA-specific 2-thiouridylase MnmA [Chlamydiota bacterium]
MNSKKTIVVGMSGGVDSSVAALLLKQQGYRVIGMFMKNWEEKDENGTCQSAKEYDDVARVCNKIDIPYYSVNFTKEYWDNVFAQCLEEFKKGHTPNPDVLCNREIKFKVLLEKAKELDGDYLATGHYCQIGENDGECQLLKGADPNKDQSYFLYTITSETLRSVLFPIGGMLKSEVREIARKHDLPTAEKKDSTGICFIGERNFKTFLNQYIDFQPGDFENTKGDVVGKHDGVSFYTIGQRKGLGIGGAGDAWYVVGKDIPRNVVIIDQGANHPALFSDRLAATELSWVSPKGPPALPCTCSSKIRYRQADHPCTLKEIHEGKALVEFPDPQRAVTPRQSIVFYDGNTCLGGGTILGESGGQE